MLIQATLCLVTGDRHVGKTTFVRAYAASLAGQGCSLGGIASPAVFRNSARIGYDMVDLRRGARRVLARTIESPGLELTEGMFWFDPEAVAEGNAAIILAVRDKVNVVVIDEAGRLELRGEGWAPALRFALAECGSGQRLFIVVREPYLDEMRRHFPGLAWNNAVRISPPWPS